MMETEEALSKGKYPKRARKQINYYQDFSMEETPRAKRKPKFENSSSEDDKEEEKENEFEEIEDEPVSEYEKLRLKNIEENRRMMMELGIIKPIVEVKKVKKPQAKPKPKVQTIQTLLPSKRSLRLQRKTPQGTNVPLEIFEGSPADSPTLKKEKARLEEDELPMNEDGESTDFLDSLKSSLSQESTCSSTDSLNNLIKDMRQLELVSVARANRTRVQGMCIHPLESKLLVISGSKDGQLGIWNATEGEVAQFDPHVAAVNCLSVDKTDVSKVFSTSHDGTVRRADLNKFTFDLVYKTTEKSNFCHITWHAQVDQNTLLVAHGTGETGVVDLRAKAAQSWYHCHPRSIRTVHLHPTQPHYFLSASGMGECKIWDLRCSKKHTDECLAELTLPSKGKGLTSAFFSPDGNRVVTTCNDDYLRFYDTSDLADPKETNKVLHDNHTGQWLSVFKTMWHPQSSDMVFVGSMLQPRRIQLYSGTGRLMRELRDLGLTTVCPVIAFHPSLPVLVGGNSTGKAHLFATTAVADLVKKEEDDSF